MGSGGKGGSGGSGSTTATIRYAPYIETKHDAFLTKVAAERAIYVDDSPFTDYTDIDIEAAFFGTGYVISSFPSLYDMYGKFMAGLDIEGLWQQAYDDTINSPVINDLVGAEGDLLDDDIEITALPRFEVGMRDLNSVMTSSFVIGKSVIESSRTKALSKFSAELKYRMLPVAQQRWQAHLQWNQNVITTYAELMKLYYASKIDVNDANYSFAAKDKLWPFTVLEYERAALGALQGARNESKDVAGASTAQKAISGALAGAATGALIGAEVGSIGGPMGAAIGGTLGLASALL